MSEKTKGMPVLATKHFSSSILLWMRTDQARDAGMNYWKGPHSQIIAATPGMEEYRQLHLAPDNPGLWPATRGVQTDIAPDRRVDGVAEVTFKSALSPLRGRGQTRLAYADEVNVFRRTLLYAGAPGWSRRYALRDFGETAGAYVLIYLRRREGVGGRTFRNRVIEGLVPALVQTGALTELRTQAFLPWIRQLWNTPRVAHDNPADQRFHASLILGFADSADRSAFFASHETALLSSLVAPIVSAVHAYEVSAALTYVRDGVRLPHHQP